VNNNSPAFGVLLVDGSVVSEWLGRVCGTDDVASWSSASPRTEGLRRMSGERRQRLGQLSLRAVSPQPPELRRLGAVGVPLGVATSFGVGFQSVYDVVAVS
jgi:hypothetical protein